LAPFLLTSQEKYESTTLCLIQMGLIYELMLKTSKIYQRAGSEPSVALEPLVEFLCRRLAVKKNGTSLLSEEGQYSEEYETSTEVEAIENLVDKNAGSEEQMLPVSVEETPLPKPNASLDYQSHLQDRERVREMIDKSAKRKKSLVKMLSEAKIDDEIDSEEAVSTPHFSSRQMAELKTPAITSRVSRNYEPINELDFQTPDGKKIHSIENNEETDNHQSQFIAERKDELMNVKKSMMASPCVQKSLIDLNTGDDSPYADLFKTRSGMIPSADVEVVPIGDNFESPQSSIDSQESSKFFNWEDVSMEKVASFQDRQPLRCCIFSEIDDTFYVGSNSKALRRFNRPSAGQDSLPMIEEFHKVHEASIYCLAMSPNGYYLATGSNDKALKIFSNAQEGLKMQTEMTSHDGTVRALQFLPDNAQSALLASGGAGSGRVYLTDVAVEQVLSCASPSNAGVITDITAPTRKQLYLTSGSTVVAWDTRKKNTEVVNLGEVPVQSLSTNTGETNFLATGSENGTVAFWDLRNTELPLYKERAHNKAVRSIAMRGQWLLAGSMDTKLSLHSLQQFQNLITINCEEKIVGVDISADIDCAISTQSDGSCHFWKISFDSAEL